MMQRTNWLPRHCCQLPLLKNTHSFNGHFPELAGAPWTHLIYALNSQ